MKKSIFKTMWVLLIVLASSLSFYSCDKDDDPIDEEIFLDGYYISGEASAFTKLDVLGKMKPTTVENDENSVREGLNEIYIALQAGKTFSITEVAGSSKMVWGAGNDFKEVDQVDVAEEMTGKIQIGDIKEDASFTVPESGLYQVVIDKQTKRAAILPVKHWAIIGGATPLGWSDNVMAAKGSFSLDEITFEITEITLLQGDYKFRHSNAWKQTISTDPEIKVNTNFGGAIDALVPGGSNIAFAKADQGVYTITAKWGKSTGMSFSMTKTGEADVPEYPENVYIIGSAFGNWEWTSDGVIEMTPVHSHTNAFWSIVYAPAGSEFKFSPVKEWKGDFGVGGTATNGIYAKGGENIKISEAGYYLVYVDLKAEKISVTSPEVYLMGGTVGSKWDYAMAEAKFTVDNTAKKITSPAFTDAAELRIYATCALSQQDTPPADWWQMEFMVLDGKIEYRGKGDDQARVSVTAGQKVVLDFSTGTGSIE